MNQRGGNSQKRNRIYNIGRTVLCDYGIKNPIVLYRTGAKLKARALETRFLVLSEINHMKCMEQYVWYAVSPQMFVMFYYFKYYLHVPIINKCECFREYYFKDKWQVYIVFFTLANKCFVR